MQISMKLVRDTLDQMPDLPHASELESQLIGAWNVIHTIYPSNVGPERGLLASQVKLGLSDVVINDIINSLKGAYERATWTGAVHKIMDKRIDLNQLDILFTAWVAVATYRKERFG